MREALSTAVYLWPSAEQRLLLEAALLEDERAIAAYHVWRRTVSLDSEFSIASLRLLPLVYDNMSRLGVREPLMGRLKGAYRRAWYETHQLFHRTQPVVERLVASGIDVLLLKGAPLVLSYYRNHALRPMADVDIAVPRPQLGHALGILESLGWRFPIEPDRDTIRFRHAAQGLGSDGGEVDLHWRVLYDASNDAAEAALWSAVEPLEFMGTRVRQLDPTHLLLHVVVHGVRWNPETPIRWIPDALVILRTRASLDWNRLVAFAVTHRLTCRLALGLSYLSEAFDAPIPSDVLSRLQAANISLLERIENTVLLRDYGRLERSPIGNQWIAFVEYCRFADTRGPFAFANGFSHFLRYRWHLNGRRDILPTILRGVRRRLARNGASSRPSQGADA